VRHATEADLDRIEDLLARLRALDGLAEPKRGKFQHRSKAFIHFHADGDDFFADMRTGGDFERRRVTSAAEQAELVAEAESLLSPPRRP
jgi:hypothetical protein